MLYILSRGVGFIFEAYQSTTSTPWGVNYHQPLMVPYTLIESSNIHCYLTSIHLNGNTLTSWANLVLCQTFSWHEIDIMSKQAQWGVCAVVCVVSSSLPMSIMEEIFLEKLNDSISLRFNDSKLNNYRTLLYLRTDVALRCVIAW